MELTHNASEREIVMTRIFDAPRALVYRAYTDAENIGKWWGPNGFTTTTHEMDVRPGGVWRFIMHGPDGKDWSNKILYKEVVAPERLVYEHGEDNDKGPHFVVTTTFEEMEGGKTKLESRLLFPTKEARDTAAAYGIEGGKQTHNRLAEYLKTL